MPEDTPQPDNSADLAALESELSGFGSGPEGEAGADGSGAPGEPASGAAGDAGKPAEVGSPAPGAAAATPATEKRYKVGDRDYTISELNEAGLLDKVVTAANQAAHFQRLHENEKRRAEDVTAELERLRQQPAQPTREEPATPTRTPALTKEGLAQIRAFFTPRIEAIKAGELGPQLAALADDLPDYVALELFRDADIRAAGMALATRLAKLEEQLGGVSSTAARYTAEAEESAFRSRYLADLDAIAGEPRYGKLKEPEHRAAFTQFVAEELVGEDDFTKVTPERLKRLYGSFVMSMSPELLDALQARAADRGSQAAAAAGEGVGRRGAGSSPGDNPIDRLARELEESL